MLAEIANVGICRVLTLSKLKNPSKLYGQGKKRQLRIYMKYKKKWHTDMDLRGSWRSIDVGQLHAAIPAYSKSDWSLEFLWNSYECRSNTFWLHHASWLKKISESNGNESRWGVIGSLVAESAQFINPTRTWLILASIQYGAAQMDAWALMEQEMDW